MPRTETVVRIFLASPGDLQPEREIVAEVVKSLSTAWTKTQNLRLELARWETDIAPGVGIDVQDVVNRQIGDDYDVFLGLFWKSLGTPTKKFASGSVEEFEKAFARILGDGSPAIMVYFKMSAPRSLDDLDPEQIVAVRSFREQLRSKGVLYREFETAKQFEEMLRLHLSQVVNDISKRPLREIKKGSLSSVENVSEPPLNTELSELDDVNEVGFLDMVVSGTEDFERVTDATKQITSRLEHFGEKLREAAAEISELVPLTTPARVKEAKRIVDSSAGDLDIFASEIEAYTPIFSAAYTRAVESYSKAASLLGDFTGEKRQQLDDARNTMRSLKTSMEGTASMVQSFRESIEALPRASTRLNRAKRRARTALDGLQSATVIAGELTTEAESMIAQLLGSKPLAGF
jgi:hypothetical protein